MDNKEHFEKLAQALIDDSRATAGCKYKMRWCANANNQAACETCKPKGYIIRRDRDDSPARRERYAN